MSEDLRSPAFEQVFANSSQLESSSMALSFQPWLTKPNQRILQLHLKSHWLQTDKTDNDIHQPRFSYALGCKNRESLKPGFSLSLYSSANYLSWVWIMASKETYDNVWIRRDLKDEQRTKLNQLYTETKAKNMNRSETKSV